MRGRQQEAAALDCFAQQLREGRLVVVGEVGHCWIMRRKRAKGESVPTLGQALAAKVRLIVWCKACGHQAEPDVADQVERCGEGMTVIDWASRLRCAACDGREVGFVVSGAAR